MEYYGGTITGLGAVKHEIVHMYFGASLVNRTWRDTWIDEPTRTSARCPTTSHRT